MQSLLLPNGHVHFLSQPTLLKHSLIRPLEQVPRFSPFPNPQQHHMDPQTPNSGLAHPSRPLKLRPLNIFSSATPVWYIFSFTALVRYKTPPLPLNADHFLKTRLLVQIGTHTRSSFIDGAGFQFFFSFPFSLFCDVIVWPDSWVIVIAVMGFTTKQFL